MWNQYILCVIVLISTTYVAYGKIQFVLSNNQGTWSAASDSCKNIRGSLAILDNVQLQQTFDRDVQPTVGEKIWVGRYVGYTKVVTIDGCYRNQTLGVRRTRVLVNNYLVTCLRECENTPYVGLQGPMCYCIDRIPTTAVPVAGTFCQTPCPGEQLGTGGSYVSQCGSTDTRFDTVSVYRRMRQGEIAMDINVPNMGECLAYNTMTSRWVPQDCNNQKRFTCDAKRCPGPAPMCVIESNVPDTWYNARGKCDVSGAHLATVNATTRVYFQQKVIMGDPLYWTGLHRKEVIAWNYDDNLRYLDQSDRCFAVSRRPDGTWEWQLDWCVAEHRFACVQDLQATPSPTLPPITTQRMTTQAPVTSATQRPVTQAPVFTTTVDPFADSFGASSGSISQWGWSLARLSTLCLTCFTSLTMLINFALFI